MSDEERDRALAEERLRVRQLRTIVDLAANVLAQGGLSPEEAAALVAATRRHVLALFPDKESVYELVLAPRFARLIEENVKAKMTRHPANVLPFRPRSG